MSIRDKFKIVEKPFSYTGKNGVPKTGVRFDIMNIRSGRRVAQHQTSEQAEGDLDRREAIKTNKRLKRREGRK